MNKFLTSFKVKDRENFTLLLLGVVCILLIISFVLFLKVPEIFEKKRPVPTRTSPPPVVNSLRQEAIELKQRLTKTDKKVGDLILEDNSDFQITYLISNNQFIVEIKKSSFDESKQEAEQWFLNKGFLANELCSLRISFAVSRQIKPDFSGKDAVPTDCPVQKPIQKPILINK